MTREQFEREKDFRAAMAVAKALLAQRLISPEEYRKIETEFLAKYRPLFGGILY